MKVHMCLKVGIVIWLPLSLLALLACAWLLQERVNVHTAGPAPQNPTSVLQQEFSLRGDRTSTAAVVLLNGGCHST